MRRTKVYWVSHTAGYTKACLVSGIVRYTECDRVSCFERYTMAHRVSLKFWYAYLAWVTSSNGHTHNARVSLGIRYT